MKTAKGFFLLLTAAWLTGCATLMPSVSWERNGNRTTYSHKKTGHQVTVNIAPAFEYRETVERRYKGVAVKGHLFSNPDASILVSRLRHDEFARLTGVSADSGANSIQGYPPETIYDRNNCRLVRAYTSALSEYVIVAAFIKRLDRDRYACDRWNAIEDVAAAHPSLLEAFNAAADQSIDVYRE